VLGGGKRIKNFSRLLLPLEHAVNDSVRSVCHKDQITPSGFLGKSTECCGLINLQQHCIRKRDTSLFTYQTNLILLAITHSRSRVFSMFADDRTPQ